MDKKVMKSLIILITYSVILILFVINFRAIMTNIGKIVMLLKPLFIGIAVAFILNKPCMHIEKFLNKKLFQNKSKSISRGISILITYLMFIIIIIALVSFVIPQFVESAELLVINIGTYLGNFQESMNKITDFLRMEDVDLSFIGTKLLQYINEIGSSITDLAARMINITAWIISFFTTLVISLVFSIYLLFGKENLIRQCRKLFGIYLPKKIYEKISYVYHVVVDVFSKYVVGQLTEAFILGGLCFVGMVIFRFEYALLISVLIGITALVPVVGAYIGGAISFILLLIISPIKAVWFLIFLLVLQQFEGNIIYPRVVGNSLGLPGIWVLLSIVVGGGAAGAVGVLFGVPIATVIYTLIKNDVKKREKIQRNI